MKPWNCDIFWDGYHTGKISFLNRSPNHNHQPFARWKMDLWRTSCLLYFLTFTTLPLWNLKRSSCLTNKNLNHSHVKSSRYLCKHNIFLPSLQLDWWTECLLSSVSKTLLAATVRQNELSSCWTDPFCCCCYAAPHVMQLCPMRRIRLEGSVVCVCVCVCVSACVCVCVEDRLGTRCQ